MIHEDWKLLIGAPGFDSADVAFKLGAATLHAHRIMLCSASPVFRRIFDLELEEKLARERNALAVSKSSGNSGSDKGTGEHKGEPVFHAEFAAAAAADSKASGGSDGAVSAAPGGLLLADDNTDSLPSAPGGMRAEAAVASATSTSSSPKSALQLANDEAQQRQGFRAVNQGEIAGLSRIFLETRGKAFAAAARVDSDASSSSSSSSSDSKKKSAEELGSLDDDADASGSASLALDSKGSSSSSSSSGAGNSDSLVTVIELGTGVSLIGFKRLLEFLYTCVRNAIRVSSLHFHDTAVWR